jgi:hypothetical protein
VLSMISTRAESLILRWNTSAPTPSWLAKFTAVSSYLVRVVVIVASAYSSAPSCAPSLPVAASSSCVVTFSVSAN